MPQSRERTRDNKLSSARKQHNSLITGMRSSACVAIILSKVVWTRESERISEIGFSTVPALSTVALVMSIMAPIEIILNKAWIGPN